VPVAIVIADDTLDETEVGEKLHDIPVGMPAQDRLALSVKPLTGVRLMVVDPLSPCTILSGKLPLAVMLKSGP
jgi:hypothetical protein